MSVENFQTILKTTEHQTNYIVVADCNQNDVIKPIAIAQRNH